MKKLLLVIAVMFAAPSYASDTTTSSKPISALLNEMVNSVLRMTVETYKGDTVIGSCGVLATGGDKTIVITAGHVTDDAKEAHITFHGTKYAMRSAHPIDGCDAAWCEFELIPGAVAIGLNLDPSANVIQSVALGYWGRAGYDNVLTGTFGTICRHAISEFSGENYTIWKAMLPGTHIVYFGYSGGVVIDEYSRLVGINSVLTPMESLSVDIRYVWNHLPWNNGKLVNIPYDTNYNFFGTPENGLKRIAVSDTDTITVTVDGKPQLTTIADLKKKLVENASDSSILISDDIVKLLATGVYTINGKTYKIAGGRIAVRNKLVGVMDGQPNVVYFYIIGDGYSLTILLKSK